MNSNNGYPPGETIFTEAEIEARTAEMGAELTEQYRGKDLVILGVLNGAVFFATALVKHIPLDLKMDFVRLGSYGNGRESSGNVEFLLHPKLDLKDKDVLIVEDIVDTGRSMNALVPEIWRLGPASVAVAALVDKPARREMAFDADYVGFVNDPPRWLVGCGLDDGERFRNLRDIRALD